MKLFNRSPLFLAPVLALSLSACTSTPQVEETPLVTQQFYPAWQYAFEPEHPLRKTEEQWKTFVDKGYFNAYVPHRTLTAPIMDMSLADVCLDENQQVLKQAVEAHPTALVSHYLLWRCNYTSTEMSQFNENYQAMQKIMQVMVGRNKGKDIKDPIEIREYQEAVLLLQFDGLTVLDTELYFTNDRYLFKIHVYDDTLQRYDIRYFSNYRLLSTVIDEQQSFSMDQLTATRFLLDFQNLQVSSLLAIPSARDALRRKNYQRAIAILAPYRDQSPLAYTLISIAWLMNGQTADFAKAKSWIEQIAETGMIEASIALAMYHTLPDSSEYSLEKATEYVDRVDYVTDNNQGSRLFTGLLSRMDNGDDLIRQWLTAWPTDAHINGLVETAADYNFLLPHGRNHQRERDLYELAIEFDNATALYNLAIMYQNGAGIEVDDEKAWQLYQQAAAMNHGGAMSNIGYWYSTGRFVEKSEETAIGWYQKASEAGSVQAMNNLAWYYREGILVEKNPEKALALYRAAADKDNAYALYNLGYLYQQGKFVDQDYQQAKTYYERAANQGFSQAVLSLAWFYMEGMGVDPDPQLAITLFKSAAKENPGQANYYLGQLYYNDTYGINDETTAKVYFEQAWKAGNKDSAVMLGYINQYGNNKDIEQAKHWYNTAWNQGKSEAGLWLAALAFNDKYSLEHEKNRETLSILTEFSTRQKFDFDVLVGDLFLNDEYFELDFKRAFPYIERAANRKDPVAINNLGEYYRFGHGNIKVDFNKAMALYQESAQLDTDVAFYNIGEMYEMGQGVQADTAKANAWYVKAAEAGFGPAMVKVARYLLDLSAHKDRDGNVLKNRAIEWLKRANAVGNAQAMELLKGLVD